MPTTSNDNETPSIPDFIYGYLRHMYCNPVLGRQSARHQSDTIRRASGMPGIAIEGVTEYWYVFRAMTPMNARTDSPVMTVTRVPPRFALSQAQELQWLS